MYRIDCGRAEQPTEVAGSSDASGSSAPNRYLFRPRDALQLLTTHELWQLDKLGALEDKTDDLINSQKYITCTQDSASVVSMLKDFSPKPTGFGNSRLKLVTFDNFIELLLRLILHLRSMQQRTAGTGTAADADEGSEDEEAADAEAGAAAPATAEDTVDEDFLRRDVTDALGWMISSDAQLLDRDAWQQPIK